MSDTGPSPDQQDALARIKQILQSYGLGEDASSWAWDRILNHDSDAVILQSLYDQPFFDKRFPYYKAMKNAGLPVLSPADMLKTEADYKRLQRSFGHEVSNNPGDYTQLFVGQVSPNEFEKRLDDYDKLRHVYGPHLRQAFEQHAGIPNLPDEQLYQLLSGQNQDLGRRYAQSTGTTHTPFTFSTIEDSLNRAIQEEQATAKTGGETAVGVGGSEEERLLRERSLALPTTNP